MSERDSFISFDLAELTLLPPCLAIVVGDRDCGADEWLVHQARELHRDARDVVAVLDRLGARPVPFSVVALDLRRGIGWFEALATVEPADVLVIESICDRTTLDSGLTWATRGVLVLTWCRGLDVAATAAMLTDMTSHPDAFRSRARFCQYPVTRAET